MIKNKKTKGEHAFKGFASTYNVEISFKLELQLKEDLHSKLHSNFFILRSLAYNGIL